jgi:uncharacterized protein YihD (DUF1040 family)
MRDPARIDILLARLRDYWHTYPDLRLGQIVTNMADHHQGFSDVFSVEDDVILQALARELEPHSRKRALRHGGTREV